MSKHDRKGANAKASKRPGTTPDASDKPIVILDANDGTPLIIVSPSPSDGAKVRQSGAAQPGQDKK